MAESGYWEVGTPDAIDSLPLDAEAVRGGESAEKGERPRDSSLNPAVHPDPSFSTHINMRVKAKERWTYDFQDHSLPFPSHLLENRLNFPSPDSLPS